MKNKKIFLSIMAVLGIWILGTNSANATTWYVRDGGGTASQCTGTTNAVYPGSGTGQACAFNNPMTALGYCNGNEGSGAACSVAGFVKSGDTLSIDGDSDINAGQQALYSIGYNSTISPSCISSQAYYCQMAPIPAGSSTTPTIVMGTGTHKPQLYGVDRTQQLMWAPNNYVTIQWLELTTHDSCAYSDPVNGCPSPHAYDDGLLLGGTGLTLTDVYIHGFARFGVLVTANLGSATFTRLWVIGNGFGGFSIGNDTASSVTGTLTFNQPIVEWNGCVEKYPLTGGIDNPSNYEDCFGQASGGYGDGLAFGPSGNLTAGNWNVIGPGSISFNTQDGLDTLHGNGNGTINIDKMRFEGNAGQQVKANGENFNLTNSIVIGDCGWWYGAAQSASGAMKLGDACRANGDAILFNVTNGSTANIFNNTILSNGSIVAESTDGESTGCNSSTAINFKNNVVYGGYYWGDDTAFNSSGGNTLTDYIYNDGNNGDGAGTCGTLTWNEDYNIVYNTKNNNQGCVGAHDKCGTNPGFASSIPMGAAAGSASTYYQGNAAATLVSLSSSSPAIATGAAGLSYWNNENDYHNVARTNPPSRGGLEANSCAVDAYGCMYNADCCGGSCTNFSCGAGGTSSQPVVSISSPSTGSSVTTGSNVTITASASESNGTITNIAIYNGSSLLGSSSASPYSYVMSNIGSGTYTLTAVAADANGVSVTSSAVTLTAAPAPVLPSAPVVSLTSPASGSSYTAGSNVTITTTASETNGTIRSISLYNGSGILLGTSSSSPYSYVYTNILAGGYTFYAVATDVNGVSTTSSSIAVSVTAPTAPVVAIISPSNGGSFTAGSSISIVATASETNGTVVNVNFYNGATLLGSDSTSLYNYVWTNVPAGTYTLTAVAQDANGVSTTSSPITVTVTASVVPVVAIVSPANGSSFTAGSTISISANASENGGTISQVQLYNGSAMLGSSGTSPCSYNWSNVSAGNYTLTAKAIDSKGVSTTSSAITVTVAAPLSSAPVVTMTSPANGSTFTKGAVITVTASASETNGTIASVSFYNGTGLLATITSAPYTYSWTNGFLTSYTVTAKATDTNGVSTTSSPVTITLATTASSPVAAITSPASGSSYASGSNISITATASESGGTISQVQFYNGSTLLGTDSTSPYTYLWTNVPAGSYSLTVKATDANGVSTTSSAVSVTVKAPASLPVVAITSPANGSSLTAGSNISITASASENNGTISKVVFYNGTTLLGTVTSSPYTFNWSNVAAGSYSLTAAAIDANGVSVTSSPITITVSSTHHRK